MLGHSRICLLYQTSATRGISFITAILVFMSLVNTTYATRPEISGSIQPPLAAHLLTADMVNVHPAVPYSREHIYSVSTTLPYTVETRLWSKIAPFWSDYRAHALNLVLWSLCISLMIMSCIIEQTASPIRLWLAACLTISWLVPISLRLHKLIRNFQRQGRADTFIVTTAMLSFVFIKAFAILGGYSAVALIRVPPCLTLAAWIASHWCKFDATPHIQFGV